MTIMTMTTHVRAQDTKRDWFIVDATDIPLGRLATRLAFILRGKHKPNFTPHVDNGDNIVVINAEKVKLTGHKRQNMEFHYHTGFAGGIKTIIVGEELDGKFPERVIERAVKRMMPKDSSLSRAMFKKLHVYGGTMHPHGAQQPKPLEINLGSASAPGTVKKGA